jgi:hypothetical protein
MRILADVATILLGACNPENRAFVPLGPSRGMLLLDERKVGSQYIHAMDIASHRHTLTSSHADVVTSPRRPKLRLTHIVSNAEAMVASGKPLSIGS